MTREIIHDFTYLEILCRFQNYLKKLKALQVE